MSHPNQMALCKCAEAWVQQSQDLPDGVAVERLTHKINTLQEKIHLLSVASYRDVVPPAEVAGLSVIDLMAAQSRLTVERAVRVRFAAMDLQVAA